MKAWPLSMKTSQLKAMAMKYKDAIAAKKDKLGKIMEKFQAIPATEKSGKDATGVTQDSEALLNSIKALQARFQVYYDKLKAQGGDVSQLNI